MKDGQRDGKRERKVSWVTVSGRGDFSGIFGQADYISMKAVCLPVESIE
jgi:hypothetical protein